MISSSVKKSTKILKYFFLGLFLLVILSMSGGIYFLKQGISVDQLSFDGVTISDSYLVWRDKLELKIDRLEVADDGKGIGSSSRRNPVEKALRIGSFISRFVSKVEVNTLSVHGYDLSVNLDQVAEQSYELHLNSGTASLISTMDIDPEHLLLNLKQVKDSRFGLDLSGQIQVTAKDYTASGAIYADIAESFPIQLTFRADRKKVIFTGAEAGVINDIKPVVDLFGLRPNIQKWITDYLSGSRYHLISLSGEYVYGEPITLFHSLEAEIKVDDTVYLFEPDIGEPLHASYTRAFFKDGVLDIRPHKPTFYMHDGGDSWLDINFNDFDNIILTTHIKARTIADDDIINLLKYYGIDLPLKQVDGETEADLSLSINLNTEDLGAVGSFSIDEGIFLYDGAELEVADVRFSLNDSDVVLEQLTVSYEEMFVARVTGNIHAGEDIWDIDIDLDHLSFDLGASVIRLDTSNKKPDISYHVSPAGDILELGASSWMLDAMKITMGAFKAPIVLEDLSAQITSVPLAIPPGILTEVSGYFSLKNEFANFDCNLLKYEVENLKLEQPSAPFNIKYVDGLIIRGKEAEKWSLSNVPITFYPSVIRYTNNVMTLAKSSFSYGNFFNSKFTGYFNTLTKQGTLYLSKIDIIHEELATEIDVGDRTIVEVIENEGILEIDFEEFDLKITADEQSNWSVVIEDLSKLYQHSELLQEYQISDGRLVISSENGNKPYNFTAEIASPYPLLVDDGVIDNWLVVKGELTEDGLFATVNDYLDFNYVDKQLEIVSRGIGFNVAAFKQVTKDFIKNNKEAEEKGSDTFALKLTAENTYLYITPQSKIIADKLILNYQGGELGVVLEHGDGQIQIEDAGGIYFFNGEKLNDEFMGSLVRGSYVQGGSLAFAGMGTVDELSAVIQLKNTVIKDLKTLNTIMALLNTLPALVTFSVPEYELKGLPVDSAVFGVKYSNGRTVFKSIDLKSSVLQAAGKGWIDLSSRQIDMDIQLSSQAGKNIRKIPIVGYVVAGDEQDSSATLKITGPLDDSEVKNSVLKEIVTMPVDILFRTLKLPFHYIDKLGDFSEDVSGDPGQSIQDDLPVNDK